MSNTAFKTYDQVGKKEDISDVISNISPTLTPFTTLVKNDKASNTLYQWQEDALATVSSSAVLEGADAADSTLAATQMRANTTQIFQKTVKVSNTADTVSTYGRAKELAYQLGKKSAEAKRDLEYAYVGLATTAVVGSEAVARKFGSVWGTDVNGAKLINAANTIDHTATPAALVEADILSANQKLYENGGEAKFLMIKPADSLIVAGFSAAAGRLRDFGADKAIVNVVDLYVSPFGEQKVVINRFQKADSALLFDPANWKATVLRNWFRNPLAITGDGHREQIVGEFGLKHVNYGASAAIIGLTGTNPTIP
jgi:hypothetical protein